MKLLRELCARSPFVRRSTYERERGKRLRAEVDCHILEARVHRADVVLRTILAASHEARRMARKMGVVK